MSGRRSESGPSTATVPGALLNGAVELVRGLVQFGIERGANLSPTDIMDLLWLAAEMRASDLFRKTQVPSDDHKSQDLKNIPSESDVKKEVFSRSTQQSPKESFPSEIEIIVPDSMRGSGSGSLKAPAPQAFPEKRRVLHALRSALTRGAARNRRRLDVIATVRRMAEERVAEFIEAPFYVRNVDAVVVLDCLPSMDVWRGLMTELGRALISSGGFRRIDICAITSREGKTVLVKSGEVNLPGAEEFRVEPPQPGSPRLYLIVSDCVSPQWQDESWLGTLDHWALGGRVAILQVLPESLWPRTRLRLARKRRVLSARWLSEPVWQLHNPPESDELLDLEFGSEDAASAKHQRSIRARFLGQ